MTKDMAFEGYKLKTGILRSFRRFQIRTGSNQIHNNRFFSRGVQEPDYHFGAAGKEVVE